jgi:hypothetical protein
MSPFLSIKAIPAVWTTSHILHFSNKIPVFQNVMVNLISKPTDYLTQKTQLQ